MDFKNDPIALEAEQVLSKLKFEKKCEFQPHEYNRLHSAFYDMIKKQKEDNAELIELRRVKEEYLSVAPRLEKFAELKGHWSTILFIPQDLGFEHQTHKPKGHHTMDVFHKDGFATTKGDDGLWIVQHGENIMKFKINNKFEAFVIFNALGLKLDQRTDFDLVVNDEEE